MGRVPDHRELCCESKNILEELGLKKGEDDEEEIQVCEWFVLCMYVLLVLLHEI